MLVRDIAVTMLPLALTGALSSLAAGQPLLGMPAPDIEFKDALNLDGGKKLSDLAGRVVLLDFFATW